MAGQHVFVAAFVLLSAVCSCASNPVRPEQSTALDVQDAHDAQVLRTHLIEGQWRLFSPVFPAITAEGYPIDFEPGGRVRTRNLPPVDTWRLTDDDGITVHLASREQKPGDPGASGVPGVPVVPGAWGDPIMTLCYDSTEGVFVFQPPVGPSFVIGPQGFDFVQYLNDLPPPRGHAAHGDR